MTATTIGVPRFRVDVSVLRFAGLPLLFGVVAAGISGVGIWTPSSSQDEAMTLSAADRSPVELFHMVTSTVDAVHGLYYSVVHVWAAVFGMNLTSIRMLSVLGVAFGAAGTVRLAQLLGGRRLALLTGTAFLTVPMITWTATEARSFAWVSAVTVWSTVALLTALRRGGRWWFAYAALAGLSVALFIYSALVVAAHLVAIAALSRGWKRRAAGLAASAAGVLAASPILVLAVQQRGQVEWIGPFTPTMLQAAAVQWFGDSQPYATVAWILIVVAIASAIGGLRRTSNPHEPERRTASAVLWLGVPWLLLPTILLLLATVVGQPSYVQRYTTVSTGAVALLLGYAALQFDKRATLVIGLLAALCLPTFGAQRLPAANGTDWADTSATVARWSRPGDGLYFAQTGAAVSPRLMLPAYRSDYADLQDLALWVPAAQSRTLIDAISPAAEVVKRPELPNRILVVSDTKAAWWSTGDANEFTHAGYTATRSRVNPETTVLLLERR